MNTSVALWTVALEPLSAFAMPLKAAPSPIWSCPTH